MEIKKKIDENQIGFINYALTISRDYPYPSKNFIAVSSGIFNDCATHDIDYLNWILNDKPISVNVCVDDHNNHEGKGNHGGNPTKTINTSYGGQ